MPEKLLLRRWECKEAARKSCLGWLPSSRCSPRSGSLRRGKKALLGWRRGWGKRRQWLAGPSCSSRSGPWGMLICFSSAYRHWASSVHFLRIVAGRLRKGNLRLDSPLTWGISGAGAARLGSSVAGSFEFPKQRQGAFPEPPSWNRDTLSWPWLQVCFRNLFSCFPAREQGQRTVSCQGNCFRELKLRRFPILFVAQVFFWL